eukprot:g3836.t1
MAAARSYGEHSPRTMGGAAGGYDSDHEHMMGAVSSDDQVLTDALDVKVRHGFIRKVFSIVAVQLLFTAVLATPFVAYKPAAQHFVVQYQALVVLAMFAPLILICCAMCNPGLMRTYPQNYLFLGLMTLALSVTVGVATLQYDAKSVLSVAVMTGLLTGSLALFALQTRVDFTGLGPYLFTFCLGLGLIGLFMMFVPMSHPIMMVYSGLAACLFCFYIIFDIQMIVGGKHTARQFAVDEYCFAALHLYMDIINLFLHLLRLFGDRN